MTLFSSHIFCKENRQQRKSNLIRTNLENEYYISNCSSHIYTPNFVHPYYLFYIRQFDETWQRCFVMALFLSFCLQYYYYYYFYVQNTFNAQNQFIIYIFSRIPQKENWQQCTLEILRTFFCS